MLNTPATGVPARRLDRRDRAAAELKIGDFVHDDFVPFTVVGFRSAPAHVVAIVGRHASGTDMTVRYLSGRRLDVSRMVATSTTTSTAPAVRRRHLTLITSPAGEVTR